MILGLEVTGWLFILLACLSPLALELAWVIKAGMKMVDEERHR